MTHVNRVLASAISVALVVGLCVNGLAQDKAPKTPGDDAAAQCAEPFDPVAFMRTFKIGMSYIDVQAALPKNIEQDTLAYVPVDESFLLGIDLPGKPAWSASFKFDTLDTPARRPEELIEVSCTANLSTRSETFDTIVRKVTAAFGDPVEVDRSQDRFQQAGWRMTGGSVLTLEYSKVPGSGADNVNIEFVVKKNPRRNLPATKAVA
ncbi:MAG TPA: hypothetical protein VLM38_20220 [Blastocatellia bacterium]|nr:hypothetical protein [Blastocatellia bacterium]